MAARFGYEAIKYVLTKAFTKKGKKNLKAEKKRIVKELKT